MSGKYTDLTLTNYPNSIDVITDRTVATGNPYLKRWEDYKDIVMAAHVKVLQDSVVALERSLGVMPFGAYGSIADRFDGMQDEMQTASEVLSSINAHKHDGLASSPSKIDIATEVTGKLLKTSIELSFGTDGALTASDISVSAGRSVANELDSKLSSGGGSISGSLSISNGITIGGNTQSKSIYESDADGFTIGADGIIVSQATAYGGTAVKSANVSASATGVMLLGTCTNLRYNRYVAMFRVMVATMPGAEDAVIKLSAGSAGTTIATRTIKGKHIAASNAWQPVYISFDHVFVQGQNNQVTFQMEHYRNNDVLCDGVVIMPTHTAVYDLMR